MDLSGMTLMELQKLNMRIDLEITKRLWYVFVIGIIIYFVFKKD